LIKLGWFLYLIGTLVLATLLFAGTTDVRTKTAIIALIAFIGAILAMLARRSTRE